jgi:hypothetical protein
MYTIAFFGNIILCVRTRTPRGDRPTIENHFAFLIPGAPLGARLVGGVRQKT